MDDPQFEIMRVLQWERIESVEISDERHPSKPMRVRPKTVEARCRQCDARWIEKRATSLPEASSWQQSQTSEIHLTCPSCRGGTDNHLLTLD